MATDEDESDPKRLCADESMSIADDLPNGEQPQENYACRDCLRRLDASRTRTLQLASKEYLEKSLCIMSSDTYAPPESFKDFGQFQKDYQTLQEQMKATEGELNSIPICHDENCELGAAKRANEAKANQPITSKNQAKFTPSPKRKTAFKNIKADKNQTPQIELSNPFSLLNEMNETTEQGNPQTTNKTMPPINLKYNDDYEKMLESVQMTCGNTTNKLNNGFIKIFTENIDQYNKVQSHLKQQGYDYYLVRPRENRPIKAVIKNLSLNHDPERVKNSLTLAGFSVIRVTRLSQFRTRKPLPFLLVDLNNTPIAKEIYNVTKINHLEVKIEEYRGRRQIPQCFKCNDFFHTAEQCEMKPRCLKCNGVHQTNQCSIKHKIDNPTCINCGETGHVAAYRGCKKFPKINTPQQNRRTFHANQSLIQSNVSFAQLLRKNQPATTSNESQQRAPLAQPIPASIPHSNTTNNESDISGLFEALRELQKLMSECPQLINALREMKNKTETIDKLSLLMHACASNSNSNPT
ncbi:Nucleic-acid-binding protein from transposon X-element [Araneus ventricosus]|uniref:Nucleic-acid-binding protein from transposon X-element n=1 Tax=Araneus ventricosus TaxID=182803 RepID=A0A4Y2WZK0_ARAVE|nr:Nucleic-acid-binding protein from transposon X-element [Araneus ventricosus]